MCRPGAVGAVAVAFIIAACHGPVSEFKPYTARAAQGYRPSVEHAVEVYEGDISRLIAAGAVLLGTMETDSNGFSTSYVRKQALRDVAARGGTHAVVADRNTIAHWLQISADQAATAISDEATTTTVTAGAILPVSGYDGTYLVVRVPPSRWSELPESVRPVRGRNFHGPYPEQEQRAAPDTVEDGSDDDAGSDDQEPGDARGSQNVGSDDQKQ